MPTTATIRAAVVTMRRGFVAFASSPTLQQTTFDRSSILWKPGLLRSMMDVEDLDRIVLDAIEDRVGIASERNCADVAMSNDAPRAGRPTCDVGHDPFDALFHGLCDGRVVINEPVGYVCQIADGFGWVNDPHRAWNLANAASTSSSLANRPSFAARRPRLMPASS
nr:hypothetical protein [Bradyrhizobium sp. SRS-191]